jgi:anti-sigma regulatory factor (Ser/Thr protein kinase)
MRLDFSVPGNDFAHAGDTSAEVKRTLKLLGVQPEFIRRTIIALYEAEINMIIHAGGGKVEAVIEPKFIYLTLIDSGPGIPDIDLAMQEGYSTASDDARRRGFGSGMGFSNMRRNTDYLHVESDPGSGTRIEMRVNFQEGEA